MQMELDKDIINCSKINKFLKLRYYQEKCEIFKTYMFLTYIHIYHSAPYEEYDRSVIYLFIF